MIKTAIIKDELGNEINRIALDESENPQDWGAEWEAEVPVDYTESRRNAYPPIGDQLDDLFKAGVFSAEMSDAIQAVKDLYPKPESEVE